VLLKTGGSENRGGWGGPLWRNIKDVARVMVESKGEKEGNNEGGNRGRGARVQGAPTHQIPRQLEKECQKRRRKGTVLSVKKEIPVRARHHIRAKRGQRQYARVSEVQEKNKKVKKERRVRRRYTGGEDEKSTR